jgi:hypothetical protein
LLPIPQVGKANEAQMLRCRAAPTHGVTRLTSMLGLAADEDVDAAPPHPPARKQEAPKTAPKRESSVRMPTEKMGKAFFAIGRELYGPDWDSKRKELCLAATGELSDSSKDLTFEQMSRLIDGMKKKLEG